MPRSLIAILSFLALTAAGRPAGAQFQTLVARIPATANTLVLINVKKIHASPQAQRENWKQKLEQAFASGLVFLPPDAELCVLASQLDFDLMKPAWEIALMELENAPSLPLIARQYKGRLESVAGSAAVALPSDNYLVALGPKTVGTLAPANRQEVARWIRSTADRGKPAISPYLQSALGFAEDVGTEIVMALDLADTFDVAEARMKLEASPALQGKKVDLDKLTKALGSLKGAMLGIRTGEKLHGKVKVDFGEDVSFMADYAKPLLLEVLAARGTKIDDFDGWKAVVKGKQFSIDGELTPTGLRRVLSVVDAPSMPVTSYSQSTTTPSEPPAATPTATAEVSKAYFRSIQHLLRDLRCDRRDSRSLGQIAGWFDIYARRIDRLPVIGVDTDVLNYSAYVSEQLRAASSAFKGVGIRYGARRASVFDPAYTYYSGNSGEHERNAAYAQERATGATSVNDIMREVDKATVSVRQSMVERYQIEF
jgi:hypothetical protein